MKTTINKLMSVLISTAVASNALAGAPTIDSFNIQSFLKLSNNSPVSATSADFVFAIFKGSNCIWAKRYAAVSINSGVMNQIISGNGTNITSINNASATPSECVINFAGTTINSTLLNTGSPAALSIRVYTETTVDTYKPIWDIPLNSAPTAFVADVANSATTATTANDLAAGVKVIISGGAADTGKFPVLNASGMLDNSVINQGSLSIAKTQITGLGTAASVNTGTTNGTIPLIGVGNQLSASLLPTYAANKIMSTNGSGALTATFDSASVGGGGSANRIPMLNGSGLFDNTMIDSTMLTPSAANLSGTIAVNKGGTGVATIPTGSLMVGAGTGAVTTVGSGVAANILVSNGATWTSAAPSASNIVDMSSAQAAIGGAKTFTAAVTHSNTSTLTGAVAMGSTLAVTGASTLTGAVTHSSTTTLTGLATANGGVKIGASGTNLNQVITCTITSALMATGTRSIACTGVSATSIVQCSPTVSPVGTSTGNSWAIIPFGTAGNVNVTISQIGAPTAWTTAFTCIAFN